jgi:hypothetical protein
MLAHVVMALVLVAFGGSALHGFEVYPTALSIRSGLAVEV